MKQLGSDGAQNSTLGAPDRRDPSARAARDDLGTWLNVEPAFLRGVAADPADALVVVTDAFEFAAQRVLELGERIATLENMVRTDHLTGVANRRGIEERLDMEASRAVRHSHGLAVIALDCDGLKAVNDTFGHHTGDEVLREVAHRVLGAVRREDMVGRVGGDEFLVVCPHSDHEGVALAARKIVGAVAEARMTAGDGRTAVPVSVSVGWAQAEGDGDWRDLVRQADQSLYEAKRRRKS